MEFIFQKGEQKAASWLNGSNYTWPFYCVGIMLFAGYNIVPIWKQCLFGQGNNLQRGRGLAEGATLPRLFNQTIFFCFSFCHLLAPLSLPTASDRCSCNKKRKQTLESKPVTSCTYLLISVLFVFFPFKLQTPSVVFENLSEQWIVGRGDLPFSKSLNWLPLMGNLECFAWNYKLQQSNISVSRQKSKSLTIRATLLLPV